MSFAKRLLLRDVPILAIGGTGVWMLVGSFRWERESRRGSNPFLNLGRFAKPEGASREKQQIIKTKAELPTPTEPKGNDTLEREEPGKDPEVPKEDTHEPQKNLKEQEHEEIQAPPENLQKPEEDQDPKNLGRSDNDEEEGKELDVVVIEEKVIPDPKQEISGVGLNCGDTTAETICKILEGGINVDKGDGKKDGYVLSGSESDNGKIRFRLSEETDTYSNGYRFTIIGKPIKLENKTNPKDTIILEKYENYGLVKEEDTGKVYLTRKLTAVQGMIKDLGLPDNCAENITSKEFDYTNSAKNPTCQPTKDQIGSINFEGKKVGKAATSVGNLNLYIQKVEDTTTYEGGYKFFLQGSRDLNLPEGVKLVKSIWWDFRMKETEEGNLSLERVWKDEKGLLNKIGLTCADNGACTIGDSLKIKIGDKSIEKGKKKSGEGTIYLEKNIAGYYQGLRFSVWGGKIDIKDSGSGSTLEMKEAEIYHITKEANPNSSFYLTRKHDAEEMIAFNLGIKPCTPNPQKSGIQCKSAHSSLWGKFKFHDGEKEQKISSKNSNLHITLTIYKDQKSPLGYRFNLEPAEDINIGKITLKAKSSTNFKIKSDVKNKKLYLEKA